MQAVSSQLFFPAFLGLDHWDREKPSIPLHSAQTYFPPTPQFYMFFSVLLKFRWRAPGNCEQFCKDSYCVLQLLINWITDQFLCRRTQGLEALSLPMMFDHNDSPGFSCSCEADAARPSWDDGSILATSFEWRLVLLLCTMWKAIRPKIDNIVIKAKTVVRLISVLFSLFLSPVLSSSTRRLFPDQAVDDNEEVGVLDKCFLNIVVISIANLHGWVVWKVAEVSGVCIDDSFWLAVVVSEDFAGLLVHGTNRTLHLFPNFAHSFAISSFPSLQHSVQTKQSKINGAG